MMKKIFLILSFNFLIKINYINCKQSDIDTGKISKKALGASGVIGVVGLSIYSIIHNHKYAIERTKADIIKLLKEYYKAIEAKNKQKIYNSIIKKIKHLNDLLNKLNLKVKKELEDLENKLKEAIAKNNIKNINKIKEHKNKINEEFNKKQKSIQEIIGQIIKEKQVEIGPKDKAKNKQKIEKEINLLKEILEIFNQNFKNMIL